MHHYREDETDVFISDATPSLALSSKPHIVIDRLNGRVWLSLGGTTVGVADTYYLQGGSTGGMFETLTAARVLTAADNGKTFWLSLAGGFDITLPALAATNLTFTFLVKTVPTTAYTITGATADKIMGHVTSSAAGAQDVALVADPGDVINFVASTAVQGDIVTVRQDGAFYYVSAHCAVDGGITITG